MVEKKLGGSHPGDESGWDPNNSNFANSSEQGKGPGPWAHLDKVFSRASCQTLTAGNNAPLRFRAHPSMHTRHYYLLGSRPGGLNMWNSVCVAGQSFKAQRIPSGLRIPTARYILMRWRPSHRPVRGYLPTTLVTLSSIPRRRCCYLLLGPSSETSQQLSQATWCWWPPLPTRRCKCVRATTHTGYRHVTCPKEGHRGGRRGCAGPRGLLLSLCWVGMYIRTVMRPFIWRNCQRKVWSFFHRADGILLSFNPKQHAQIPPVGPVALLRPKSPSSQWGRATDGAPVTAGKGCVCVCVLFARFGTCWGGGEGRHALIDNGDIPGHVCTYVHGVWIGYSTRIML